MKAMILAAGFGTRLHPITQDTPKALIRLAGHTLLEIALARLSRFGFDEIAVNLHHHAEKVDEFVRSLRLESTTLHLSYEEKILGTGGGVKKMAGFFTTDEPILVHNVDVLTDLDLTAFYQKHLRSGAIATLAVQSRETKRYLLFDGEGILCGRVTAENPQPQFVRRPSAGIGFRAFNGLQVIHPEYFLAHKAEQFSSVDLYMELAGRGEKIAEYRMEGSYWRDLGKSADLQQAEEDIRRGLITID